MKLIDLFNKIVNGEELPNKIKIRNDILVRNKEYHLPHLQDYYYRENVEEATWRIWYYDLNDEVEIIGEGINMETRIYEIKGKKENLDTLEKALRHIEYLGNVGSSRNILIRVDGDGDGRIRVNKVTTALIRDGKPIDSESYNLEQKDGPIVGVYDIE